MKRGGPGDWAFYEMAEPLQRIAERLPDGDEASTVRIEYATVIPGRDGAPFETSVGSTCAPDTYTPPGVGLPTIVCDEKVMVTDVESIREWDDETGRTLTWHTVQLRAVS